MKQVLFKMTCLNPYSNGMKIELMNAQEVKSVEKRS